ncbi:TIR domain-containing protein [Caulobacter sp. CCNWLY153]|uniref:Toll/interleukin-1 receptor domain-containing protein n=1 Tax=Caulobacter radicis TaxID=2172650 RepID=A0A2T9JIL5_9CAUL|nr:TIR domain-containing protein [Caulobacter radicis]PVM79408.1 toll/interleukin-1 receptor domain-containing protein [Caulobacter radicis]PVM83533.1 toll/interleukin-1 receptor domain-containing protein [Caulobacter radicis]
MAKIQHYSGGRKVSASSFWKNIEKKGLDLAMSHIEARAHGAAGSIVDPETGKHAAVFVRRVGEKVVARTEGSPAFARELERRLGVGKGVITSMQATPSPETPVVYLAHASEDHERLAKPLAERLMAAGIEVWLDAWEIKTGDSLKRRMEEGLEACTHFLVLLTPYSVGKPWVETEIDAGFMKAVQSKARFLGLRIGARISDLSIFLQTTRCPEVDLEKDAEIEALIADLYGVTKKPPRGTAPSYVRKAPSTPSTWSKSAAAVAEFLVRNSQTGRPSDPQVKAAAIAEATGLSIEDIRIGALDLEEAGLIERSKQLNGERSFWPRQGLFVEFDNAFMDFDNRADALSFARRLISEGVDGVRLAEAIPEWFPDWTVRQANSALNYLEEAKLVDAYHTLGQPPYTAREVHVTDRTRRFVRDHD